jgi:hypothetical protein
VSADVLIREAIERAVDYDDWFIAKSRRGSPRSNAGRALTRDAVAARLELTWPSISPVADGDPVDPGGSRGSRTDRYYLFEHTAGHAERLVLALYEAPATVVDIPEARRAWQ